MSQILRYLFILSNMSGVTALMSFEKSTWYIDKSCKIKFSVPTSGGIISTDCGTISSANARNDKSSGAKVDHVPAVSFIETAEREFWIQSQVLRCVSSKSKSYVSRSVDSLKQSIYEAESTELVLVDVL